MVGYLLDVWKVRLRGKHNHGIIHISSQPYLAWSKNLSTTAFNLRIQFHSYVSPQKQIEIITDLAGAIWGFKFIVTTYPLWIIYISWMASKKTTTATTSKAPVATSAPKGKHFEPKQYEKPGLAVDQINDVKITFDLFDTDGTGSI